VAVQHLRAAQGGNKNDQASRLRTGMGMLQSTLQVEPDPVGIRSGKMTKSAIFLVLALLIVLTA
jgi:hypothetical protein